MSIVRRYVVPNSANVLIGESILSLKKIHTLALNTSLQKKKKKEEEEEEKKKLDQVLNLAIGFAVQSSSLQGSPINVRAKILWNKPTLIITTTKITQGYAIQQYK